MVGLKSRRFIGLCTFIALALPALAFAQASTFIVPFDRTGLPGTQTIETLDPLTLQPVTIIVDTGAFKNPCTLENVDVLGTSTISTLTTIDKFGTRKVDVSVLTKGTGAGWTGIDYATRVISGSTYTFNENQNFSFRVPTIGQEFTSDFTDKLAMKGAKSIDNWVIRANFRIKVNADGTTQVFMIKLNADACKG